MADKQGPKRAAQKKAWAARNRAMLRTYHRRYHAKRKTADHEYAQSKRDASRHARRKSKYGLSRQQFEAMVVKQRGLCLICQGHKGLKLRVDHDHTTLEVRGLLCANCNSGIGLLQESPEVLEAAKRYLQG